MSVERYKRSLSKLQQQHDIVQQQVDNLSSKHHKLQLRSSTVASWCDAFSALLSAQTCDGSLPEKSVDALSDLLVEEAQLLQQLVPAAVGQPIAALCEPTIKELLSRPIVPDAEHMTLKDVAQHYVAAIQESSILLHAWDSQLGNRATIEQQVIDIWKRSVSLK